jgi:cytolysin (calcineurin-like family phosphatase)
MFFGSRHIAIARPARVFDGAGAGAPAFWTAHDPRAVHRAVAAAASTIYSVTRSVDARMSDE